MYQTINRFIKYSILASLCICLNLKAETLDASQNSPQFIIHLLDYLAGDYGGAVKNGKVVTQSEYNEQVEFSETIAKLSTTLPEIKDQQEIVAKINLIKSLIEKKSDAKDVALTARETQKLIIKTLNLTVAPTKAPSFENGKKLFANNCISCHGTNGFGDGPDSLKLNPKPTNFHNNERMKEITVFHCFNTIRLGVPGTAMVPWHELSDKDVWDLATFVMGKRFENNKIKNDPNLSNISLDDLTTLTDEQIKNKLSGAEEDKNSYLAFLRTNFNQGNNNDNDGIKKARKLLEESKEAYEKNQFKTAENIAVNAYLEGIEPIEPALKVNAPNLLPKIETAMAEFRKAVKKDNNLSSIELKITEINTVLDEIQSAIEKKEMSFTVAFTGAFAIILREGFEAVLVIVTLLSVLKTFNNKKATAAVHLGWILALGVGLLTWLVSGALINVSGMGQEMIEAVTSIVAVVILLYFGFWLHRQTEITRWKKFIEEKVKSAIDNSNVLAIGSISFMATYREAFETVLFIRTIWTQSGVAGKNGIGIGLIFAFGVVFAFSILAIKYSSKLPVKKLFQVSAWMMCALAFILTGKAIHAFQAVGLVGISMLPINFSIELIGLHSTIQTLLSQLGVGVFSVMLLNYSQSQMNHK